MFLPSASRQSPALPFRDARNGTRRGNTRAECRLSSAARSCLSPRSSVPASTGMRRAECFHMKPCRDCKTPAHTRSRGRVCRDCRSSAIQPPATSRIFRSSGYRNTRNTAPHASHFLKSANNHADRIPICSGTCCRKVSLRRRTARSRKHTSISSRRRSSTAERHIAPSHSASPTRRNCRSGGQA